MEELSGLELDWFWQRYLFAAELPTWNLSRVQSGAVEHLEITWDDASFEMPLPVNIGGRRRLIDMTGGRASLEVDSGTKVVIDPNHEILTAEPKP